MRSFALEQTPAEDKRSHVSYVDPPLCIVKLKRIMALCSESLSRPKSTVKLTFLKLPLPSPPPPCSPPLHDVALLPFNQICNLIMPIYSATRTFHSNRSSLVQFSWLQTRLLHFLARPFCFSVPLLFRVLFFFSLPSSLPSTFYEISRNICVASE